MAFANSTAGGFRSLLERPASEANIYLMLTTVSVIGLAALSILAGPSHIVAPWDVFILIDGAWRMFLGQVPHTDFHNPIGPLVYAVFTLGMKIAGPSLHALVYGNAGFMVVLSLWATAVCRSRLTPFLGFLFVIFIAFMLIATRPLGYDPQTTSYAMLYNRYGWCLLLILSVQLLIPPRHKASKFPLFDTVSPGLLLGLIFFCKITFFFVGCGTYAIALLLRPELRGGAWLTATAFAAVIFSGQLILGINIGDYLRDIVEAGESQSLQDRGLRFLKSARDAFPQMAVLLFYWLLVVGPPAKTLRWLWGETGKITLLISFVVASAFLLTMSNTGEKGDIPLLIVAGLLLSDYAHRRAGSGLTTTNALNRAKSLAVWTVPVLLIGGIFFKDAKSLQYTVLQSNDASAAMNDRRFDAGPLHDFVIPGWSDWKTAYWLANEVPGKINDGLSLLRRNKTRDARTFVLAQTDPFSFALGLPSVKGVPLWWDIGVSHGAGVYPASRLFQDVDQVIIPVLTGGDQGCCSETVRGMLSEYGGYLRRHFAEVDRSSHWVLLRRQIPAVVSR